MMRRMLRVIESLGEYTEDAKKRQIFELGEMYINSHNVTFSIENTHRDLFDNAVRTINGFKFASKRMGDQMVRFLPKIVKTFEVEDRLVMVLEKSPDLILLRNVSDYFKGKMDPKHVAWILSSLHNLVCYFGYEKLSHNDISMDTYFISPEFHNGVLLGGWWYATELGKKMLAVPSRTFNLLPEDVKAKKGGDVKVDLDLIRAVGRELLGDPTGTKLSEMKAAPEPMVNWLRLVTTGRPVDDYRIWKNEVIPESFGGHFFTPMRALFKSEILKSSDVYEEVK